MFFRRKKKIVEEKIEEEIIHYDFTFHDLDLLVDYLKFTCGVDLESKKSVLIKKLGIFCENKKIATFRMLLDRARTDKNIMQELVNLVTVNETYFYRELLQLQECIEFVKQKKHKTRILCAPCATGEEVYSLSFLANRANVNQFNLEILGIDINSYAIDCATRASYSARSLHRLDEATKNEFFTKKDDLYWVKKEKIFNVDFKVINIFDNEFKKLGKFDIIFSRNMMIYFNDEFKLKAIKSFHEILNKDGRLYTGHADLVPESKYFRKVVFNRLYYYNKEDI